MPFRSNEFYPSREQAHRTPGISKKNLNSVRPLCLSDSVVKNQSAHQDAHSRARLFTIPRTLHDFVLNVVGSPLKFGR
jgi:hypothetical protein